jgi:hypothetical protein
MFVEIALKVRVDIRFHDALNLRLDPVLLSHLSGHSLKYFKLFGPLEIRNVFCGELVRGTVVIAATRSRVVITAMRALMLPPPGGVVVVAAMRKLLPLSILLFEIAVALLLMQFANGKSALIESANLIAQVRMHHGTCHVASGTELTGPERLPVTSRA